MFIDPVMDSRQRASQSSRSVDRSHPHCRSETVFSPCVQLQWITVRVSMVAKLVPIHCLIASRVKGRHYMVYMMLIRKVVVQKLLTLKNANCGQPDRIDVYICALFNPLNAQSRCIPRRF